MIYVQPLSDSSNTCLSIETSDNNLANDRMITIIMGPNLAAFRALFWSQGMITCRIQIGQPIDCGLNLHLSYANKAPSYRIHFLIDGLIFGCSLYLSVRSSPCRRKIFAIIATLCSFRVSVPYLALPGKETGFCLLAARTWSPQSSTDLRADSLLFGIYITHVMQIWGLSLSLYYG